MNKQKQFITILIITALFSILIYPQVAVTSGNATQAETAITVDPNNPNHLMATWRDYSNNYFNAGYSFSSDCGYSWLPQNIVPNVNGIASDPSCAIDRSGREYYTFMIGTAIYISYTTNDNVNGWSNPPVQVSSESNNQDKPYMAVDNTAGTHDGNIYIAWTNGFTAYNEIDFAYTSNIDSSWKQYTIQKLTDSGGGLAPLSGDGEKLQSAIPVVAPDGTVYITYLDIDSSLTFPHAARIKLWKYVPNDNSFTNISSYLPNMLKNFQGIGDAGITYGNLKIHSYPTIAIDPRPNTKNIYLAFVKYESGGNLNIYTTRSTNGGINWSSPTKLSHGTSEKVFMPWLTVNPAGIVSLSYYARNSSGLVDVYIAQPNYDSKTISSDIRITSTSENPNNTIGSCDYIGAVYANGETLPIWTNPSSSSPHIYTSPYYYNGSGTISQSLTIPQGQTVVFMPGSEINFGSNTSLTVNGKLIADRSTFTSNSSSWKGITLNSADGSSINLTTISKALSPIIINNTNNMTISGCTINNSSFYDNNSSSAAAIQINNSSPTISLTTIEGQTNSWNGVRFTNNSAGSLADCTIENLGYGNGVIVQGSSSPTISYNNINHNYYYGIYINGTGTSTVLGNNLDYNGTGGSYTGLYFYTGNGVVRGNTIKHSYYGLWSRYSSSVTAGGVGQSGANTITNNTQRGILSTDYSSIGFGAGNPHKNQYWGTCNNIYSNTLTDAYAVNNSYIVAEYNWWGQYPPNSSQFYADGTSSIDHSYPEQYQGDCPGLPPELSINSQSLESTDINGMDPQSVINLALDTKFGGNLSGAKLLCRDLLAESKISDSFHMQALSILFNIFQTSGDTTIVDDFKKFISSNNQLSPDAGLLLSTIYASLHKTADAENVINNVIAANTDPEIEKRALITLASLSTYDPTYKDKSKTALNELVSKYGSSVDAGVLAAFGVSVNNSISKQANLLNSETNETEKDTLKFSLGNYPNPFNPTTVIHYVLPKAGLVTVKVYDMLGREVRTLVNEYKVEGVYDVTFNASDLASGVYIYQLRSGNFTASKKLLLMK